MRSTVAAGVRKDGRSSSGSRDFRRKPAAKAASFRSAGASAGHGEGLDDRGLARAGAQRSDGFGRGEDRLRTGPSGRGPEVAPGDAVAEGPADDTAVLNERSGRIDLAVKGERFEPQLGAERSGLDSEGGPLAAERPPLEDGGTIVGGELRRLQACGDVEAAEDDGLAGRPIDPGRGQTAGTRVVESRGDEAEEAPEREGRPGAVEEGAFERSGRGTAQSPEREAAGDEGQVRRRGDGLGRAGRLGDGRGRL